MNQLPLQVCLVLGREGEGEPTGLVTSPHEAPVEPPVADLRRGCCNPPVIECHKPGNCHDSYCVCWSAARFPVIPQMIGLNPDWRGDTGWPLFF